MLLGILALSAVTVHFEYVVGRRKAGCFGQGFTQVRGARIDANHGAAAEADSVVMMFALELKARSFATL